MQKAQAREVMDRFVATGMKEKFKRPHTSTGLRKRNWTTQNSVVRPNSDLTDDLVNQPTTLDKGSLGLKTPVKNRFIRNETNK